MSQLAPDAARWYVCPPGGQPEGPFDARQLRNAAALGVYSEASQVCRVGDQTWHSLGPFLAWLESSDVPDPPTIDDDDVATQRNLDLGGGAAADRGTLPMPLVPAMAAAPPPPASPAPLPVPAPVVARRPTIAKAALVGGGFGVVVLCVVGFFVWRSTSAEPTSRTLAPDGSTDELDGAGGSSHPAARSAPGGSAPGGPAPASSASSSAPGAAGASAGEAPAAASSADDESAGDDATCREMLALPEKVCAWVRASARGEVAPRPAYEDIQTYLVERDILRAKGRIHGRPAHGLVKVTLDGQFGYCLVPDGPVEEGALYNKWVRKVEGTREVELSEGRPESCAVLEELGMIAPIIALMEADDGVDRTALARDALAAIARYHRFEDSSR
jgi:hypothetical protein